MAPRKEFATVEKGDQYWYVYADDKTGEDYYSRHTKRDKAVSSAYELLANGEGTVAHIVRSQRIKVTITTTEAPHDPPPNEPPVLVAPALVVETVAEDESSETIRASWDPVFGADGYLVRSVRLNGGARSEVVDRILAGSSLQVTHRRSREEELSPYQMCVTAFRVVEGVDVEGPASCGVADIEAAAGTPPPDPDPTDPDLPDEPVPDEDPEPEPAPEDPEPEPEPLPDPEPVPDPNGVVGLVIWERDFQTMTPEQFAFETGEYSKRRERGWDNNPDLDRLRIDPGRGLRFHWPERHSCRDNTVRCDPWLGQEVKAATMIYVLEFDPWWTTIMPGCSREETDKPSNPDHKCGGFRVTLFGGGTSGATRFGFLLGNGYGQKLQFNAPGQVDKYLRLFNGGSAQPIWDGDMPVLVMHGKVNTEPGSNDGAAGFWIGPDLNNLTRLVYEENLAIERRGIYAAYISRNLNQGPEFEQSMWAKKVQIFEGLPAGLPLP